jgi:hypothetical protein
MEFSWGAGDEEDVVVMGGEGFSAEQIEAAEKDFERRLVRHPCRHFKKWHFC